MSISGRKTRSRWLRLVLGLILGGIMAWAIVRGWSSARPLLVRPPATLVIPVALIALGLVFGARMWILLARERSTSDGTLARAFLVALPARYLPGGAGFQAMAQIGLSLETRADLASTSVAYAVLSVIQLISGATVGSLVSVFGAQVGTPFRVIAGVGVLAVLGLQRERMSTLLRLALRLIRRSPASDPIPPQSSLNWSFLLAVMAMVSSGVAFTLLLEGSLEPVLRVIPAFAAAWALGFAVAPIPAGLGIREAALIALLPGYSAPAVIAASVLYRFSSLAAELVLMGAAWPGAFVARHHRRGGRRS